MNKNGNKVYFACPMFNQAEKEYNLRIVHILEENGYELKEITPTRETVINPVTTRNVFLIFINKIPIFIHEVFYILFR